MGEMFADWGTPEFLVSDNGPQFRAKEFKDFCHSRNVTPIYTSPLHSSGNGQVERIIGTVKGMMKRSVRGQTDWLEGLTTLRNTPVGAGLLSPAKLLQGRALRDSLPVDTLQYKVLGYDYEQMKELLGERQSKMKHYHNSHAEKELFKIGSSVVFKTAKGT